MSVEKITSCEVELLDGVVRKVLVGDYIFGRWATVDDPELGGEFSDVVAKIETDYILLEDGAVLPVRPRALTGIAELRKGQKAGK